MEADVVFVAPDAGALKKIYDIAQGRQVVCAEKTRDPATGKLSGVRVSSDDAATLVGRRVWVVDDICDGGGTFIQLINCIRRNVPSAIELDINLFVTHGIFSRGKMCLHEAGYRTVVAANDWTCNE
jgi:ribose-phosphate pyrophosphokinase